MTLFPEMLVDDVGAPVDVLLTENLAKYTYDYIVVGGKHGDSDLLL